MNGIQQPLEPRQRAQDGGTALPPVRTTPEGLGGRTADNRTTWIAYRSGDLIETDALDNTIDGTTKVLALHLATGRHFRLAKNTLLSFYDEVKRADA